MKKLDEIQGEVASYLFSDDLLMAIGDDYEEVHTLQYLQEKIRWEMLSEIGISIDQLKFKYFKNKFNGFTKI